MGSPGNINNINNIRSAADIGREQIQESQDKFTFKVKIGAQSFKVWIPNTEDNKTDRQQKLFEVIQKVKAIKPAYETPETTLSEKFSSITFGKNKSGDATMKCVYKDSYATQAKTAKWAETENAPVEKEGKFEKTHVINKQKFEHLGKRLQELSEQIKEGKTNKSDVKDLEAKFARTQEKSFAFLNIQNIVGKSLPTESAEGTYIPLPKGEVQDKGTYGSIYVRDSQPVRDSQYETGPVSSFQGPKQGPKQEIWIYGDTAAARPPEGGINGALPPIDESDDKDKSQSLPPSPLSTGEEEMPLPANEIGNIPLQESIGATGDIGPLSLKKQIENVEKGMLNKLQDKHFQIVKFNDELSIVWYKLEGKLESRESTNENYEHFVSSMKKGWTEEFEKDYTDIRIYGEAPADQYTQAPEGGARLDPLVGIYGDAPPLDDSDVEDIPPPPFDPNATQGSETVTTGNQAGPIGEEQKQMEKFLENKQFCAIWNKDEKAYTFWHKDEDGNLIGKPVARVDYHEQLDLYKKDNLTEVDFPFPEPE